MSVHPGTTSLEVLIEKLRTFRDERNWAQFHTPKDLAISVSVEAGELLELFQWRPASKAVDEELLAGVKSEAADVLLYLLLLCDHIGVDLAAAAAAKIEQNAARFPVATSRDVAKPTDATEVK